MRISDWSSDVCSSDLVAQSSIETALDMADVFDDEADSDAEITPHLETQTNEAPFVTRYISVRHIDLDSLPEDDSRLYKHIKRLDEANLLAHMEAALKVLQDGTRELESLKIVASSSFRRRDVAKLAVLVSGDASFSPPVDRKSDG